MKPETQAKYERIRQMVAEGNTYKAVGEVFGASKQRIHQIVTGYQAPGQKRDRREYWKRYYDGKRLESRRRHAAYRRRDGKATGEYYPIGLRFEILNRDHFTCRYCGRSAPDVVLQVDHVVPESKGGPTTPENLVTACRDCNCGKRDVLLAA